MALSETTRLTIDFPKKEHRKLKALAAIMGISLKELILGFVHDGLEKIPNADTLAAIKDAAEGKTHEYSSVAEMRKKLCG